MSVSEKELVGPLAARQPVGGRLFESPSASETRTARGTAEIPSSSFSNRDTMTFSRAGSTERACHGRPNRSAPAQPGQQVGRPFAPEGAQKEFGPGPELPGEERRIHAPGEQDSERTGGGPQGPEGLLEGGVETVSQGANVFSGRYHRTSERSQRLNPYPADGFDPRWSTDGARLPGSVPFDALFSWTGTAP